MEYAGILWILVPIITMAVAIIKWLFWLLLCALLFTRNDLHLRNSRMVVFAAITVLVLLVIVSEKMYNLIGIIYVFSGLLTYSIFHFISGAINKSEKRRKKV
jgi:hypothetical protein